MAKNWEKMKKNFLQLGFNPLLRNKKFMLDEMT